MKDLLVYIDLFGYKEELKIQSKGSYKSILGGILSLIFLSFSITMIFYLGLELFLKQEAIVIETRQQKDTFGPYYFGKDGIEIFVSLQNKNMSYYIDERIYKVKALQVEMDYISNSEGQGDSTDQVTKFIELEMVKCTDIYTSDDLNSRKLNYPMDSFFCLKSNATLENFWGSQEMKSMRIQISKCENTTESSNCLSQEEIDSEIEGGIAQFFFSTFFINQNDYENPIHTYYAEAFDFMTPNNGLTYMLFYQNVDFVSDDGLLFHDNREYQMPLLQNVKNGYAFGENKIIANLMIEGTEFGYKYNRSYSKIQDVLTKTGGLIKGLQVIGMLINYFFAKSMFMISNYYTYHQNFQNFRENNIIRENFQNLDNIVVKELEKQANVVKSENNKTIIQENNYFHNVSGNILQNVFSSQVVINSGCNNKVNHHTNLSKKNEDFSNIDLSNVDLGGGAGVSNLYTFKKESLKMSKKSNKLKFSFYLKNIFIYWFSCKSQLKAKILQQEFFLKKVSSIETISELYHDVEMIKLLLLEEKDFERLNMSYRRLYFDDNLEKSIYNYLVTDRNCKLEFFSALKTEIMSSIN